jgi:hypothetical protein
MNNVKYLWFDIKILIKHIINFIQVKLTKISYIGTLYKVLFNYSGLFGEFHKKKMHQNFSYSTKKSEIGSKCAESLNGVMVHTSDWLWLQQAAIQEKNMFKNTWKLLDKGALLMGQGIVRLYYRKSDLDP